jgi:hypothetical protein
VLKAKYTKFFIEFERKGKLQLIKNILEHNDSVKKGKTFQINHNLPKESKRNDHKTKYFIVVIIKTNIVLYPNDLT